MATVDFALAKSKHLLWKTRLHAFLAGKESLTPDQAVSHTSCDLGKWLHFDGLKKYGHIPEMKKLEGLHIDLHTTVKAIVEKKHGGDAAGAQILFGKIEPLSTEIVGLLTSLEKQIKD